MYVAMDPTLEPTLNLSCHVSPITALFLLPPARPPPARLRGG